jgi:hypothetical protein
MLYMCPLYSSTEDTYTACVAQYSSTEDTYTACCIRGTEDTDHIYGALRTRYRTQIIYSGTEDTYMHA